MSSGTSKATSTQSAIPAQRLQISINGITGPVWDAQVVNVRLGNKPSELTAVIPLPLNTAATLREFTKGSIVEVVSTSELFDSGVESQRLFTGFLTAQPRNLTMGTVEIVAQDARWLMDGAIAIGQWFVDLAGEKKFRQSVDCVMNPDGAPNCTLNGGEPYFCSPYMGLGNNQGPEVAHGKAGFWTVNLAAQYFRNVFTSSDFQAAAQTCGVNGLVSIYGGQLDWPDTIANALTISGSTDGSNPLARGVNWQGKSALTIMSILCEQAGPFALYVAMDSAIGQLRVVPSRYGAAFYGSSPPATVQIPYQTAGKVVKQLAVIGGSTNSDAANAFTVAGVEGDPIEIERRTYSEDQTQLIPAWTATEEANYKAFLKAQVPIDTSDHSLPFGASAFAAANAKWPTVYAAYVVNPYWAFEAETDLPVQSSIYRAFASRLRSSAQNTLTDLPNPEVPYSVYFETTDPDAGSPSWQLWEFNVGFTVDEFNRIWLTGPRGDGSNSGAFNANTWQGTVNVDDTVANIGTQIDAIKAVPIRATVVLQTDQKVSAFYTRGNDGTKADVYSAPGSAFDSTQWASGIGRLKMASRPGAYIKQRRQNSYPVPFAEMAANGDLINETERCRNDARALLADAGRMNRTATLIVNTITSVFPPGTNINALPTAGGNIPVTACVHEVRYDSVAQTTTLIAQ